MSAPEFQSWTPEDMEAGRQLKSIAKRAVRLEVTGKFNGRLRADGYNPREYLIFRRLLQARSELAWAPVHQPGGRFWLALNRIWAFQTLGASNKDANTKL